MSTCQAAGCRRRADFGGTRADPDTPLWCIEHAPPLAWWRETATGRLAQWGYPPPAGYEHTALGPAGEPFNDYLAEHYPEVLAAHARG